MGRKIITTLCLYLSLFSRVTKEVILLIEVLGLSSDLPAGGHTWWHLFFFPAFLELIT